MNILNQHIKRTLSSKGTKFRGLEEFRDHRIRKIFNIVNNKRFTIR